ncbi:MAG: hypothetical protein KC619_09070 [Myxococcales bacterium]|nr:hypothetical protein [Myxococcales bacterium]
MGELLPTLFVIGVGLILFVIASRGLDRRRELPWLAFSFVAHIVAAFGQVWATLVYYRGGDALMYHAQSAQLSRLVIASPHRYLPEVLTMLVQGDARFPFPVPLIGTSTGSQVALTSLIEIPCLRSYVATSVAYSLIAFVGARLLYQVFRDRFPVRLHVRLLVATMAIPSVVFWTSGILKEVVASAAFGAMVLAIHWVSRDRWLKGVLLLVPSVIVTAVFKGYVAGTFFVAAGVFLYWSRALGRGTLSLRPAYMVSFGLAAVLAVLVLGRVLPRYSVDGIVDEAARLQTLGMRVEGGSNYELGSSDDSLATQALLAPLALLTALFRPLPFEVSGVGAVNGFETVGFLLWFLYVAARRRWGDVYRVIRGSPILVFSVVFIVLFGIGVGLASTNLGTLSRYRAPMMPLFASLLIVVQSLAPAIVRTKAPVSPPAPSRRRRPATSAAEQ